MLGFSEAVAVDGVMGDLNPVAGVMTVPLPTSLSAAIASLKVLVPSIPEYLLGVMKLAYTMHETQNPGLEIPRRLCSVKRPLLYSRLCCNYELRPA